MKLFDLLYIPLQMINIKNSEKENVIKNFDNLTS